MADTAPYRLPRTVLPERYDLTLVPDLEAATFTGTARIKVRVVEAVEHIVLNAIDLVLDSARIVGPGIDTELEVHTRAEEERVELRSAAPLPPGEYDLVIDYTGELNDKLHGFYRSTYHDDAGVAHTIATTQFEATDARRAFPCWDEPDFKAVFAITLTVPDGLTGMSNGPVIEEEKLPGGGCRLRFADTIPMSTYVVAWVVGPFEWTEPVDVEGVALRVAAVPGKAHLTSFAVEAGVAALRFLARYFELPYPGTKIDHVAIPDFAFGAMENLGCVTYRETALLVDSERASRLELERVAQVVAHETAHMWFGDLVTMRWWDGIWLNEAFATFMEITASEAFRPEWRSWVSFGAARAAALATDGLMATRPVQFPVGRPEEAEGMFDVLTYQKGAAVLRMLEQHLGPEVFRRGIVRYLADHVYGNTETTDLWDAIETEAAAPARATMDSWILQGGYPLITARPDGAALVLSQRRFLYAREEDAGSARWKVPVAVRAEVDGAIVERHLLLEEPEARVDLPGEPAWAVVDAGASGFYRTRYEGGLQERLVAVAPDRLEPLERLGLVGDTWAAALAGLASPAELLTLGRRLGPTEDDPDVWGALLGPLSLLDRLTTDAVRPALHAYVREVVGPAFARLGWDARPGEGERTGTLRARLLSALGSLGREPSVVAEAQRRHQAYLADRDALAPDLVSAVVAIVAQAGGTDQYEVLLERFRNPATPQEEIRYLYSLAANEEPTLLRRTLELCLGPEVRTQDAPYVVGDMLGDRVGGRIAWEFITARWDDLRERFPDNSIPRMLEAVSWQGDADLARSVRTFLEANPVPQGDKLIAQALERLDVNVAFVARCGEELAAALEVG